MPILRPPYRANQKNKWWVGGWEGGGLKKRGILLSGVHFSFKRLV